MNNFIGDGDEQLHYLKSPSLDKEPKLLLALEKNIYLVACEGEETEIIWAMPNRRRLTSIDSVAKKGLRGALAVQEGEGQDNLCSDTIGSLC